MHSFDAVPFGCFIFLLQCFSYQTGANYCDICSFITSRIFFSHIFMSNSVHGSVRRVAFITITIAFRIIEITVMIQHRITTDNQNKWPILRRVLNYNRRQSMRDEVRWFRAKSGHPPNSRLFAIFWTRSIFHVEQHISTIFGVIFLNRVWEGHFGPTIDIRLN